jgi:hypothetical protein
MKNIKHTKFIYHSYTIEENGFSYHFSMGNLYEENQHEFRPRWICSIPLTGDALHELVFHLGMVELVSYWKSACPPIVEVRCGSLDDWQINWWKKLYRKGLGEFFYVNGIVPDDDFMTIISTGEKRDICAYQRELSGCLIPVGGGKDSIVTLELLRESMDNHHCYIVGDIKRAYDCAKTAGYPDSRIIQVKRTIDPALLELNRRGYLNGHTPFSAVIAFSSLIFAHLFGKKYIVLSNESSANEGNVSDCDINHQYSKSTEFESDFREYTKRINPDLPDYFSLLRPLNELQITERFTRYPQYFPVFQSCNAGTKANIWCCKCAKCLYVYIMLSAFVDENKLKDIFGENLLKKPELADLLKALIDPQYDKPFECVGTREEINYALNKSANSDLMNFFDSGNFVPEEFLRLLD